MLFLCTMQSVCVNDASFKREMLLLKGFFFVISHTKEDFSGRQIGQKHEKFPLMTRRQRMPGAAALTAVMARVPVPVPVPM